MGGAPRANDVAPHGQHLAHSADVADIVSRVVYIRKADGQADCGKTLALRAQYVAFRAEQVCFNSADEMQ